VSTNLREVLVGLLMDQPAHAYALKKILAPRFSPSEEINDGVLYPLLSRLEAEGIIRGREEISKSNRKRTIYRVTQKGARSFLAWLESDVDEADEPAYDFFMGHPLLVKVQFFARLPPLRRAEKLAAQLQRTEQKLKDFAEIRKGMVERNADPFRIALLDLGVSQQKASRKWLREQLDALKQEPRPDASSDGLKERSRVG
jgi:DNA-binding PadR family transcriptional regulator